MCIVCEHVVCGFTCVCSVCVCVRAYMRACVCVIFKMLIVCSFSTKQGEFRQEEEETKVQHITKSTKVQLQYNKFYIVITAVDHYHGHTPLIIV